MKRILLLILLSLFAFGCSTDDNDKRAGDKPVVDSRLFGTWDVVYSKKIEPAEYDEIFDAVMVYSDNLSVHEYFGDYRNGIGPSFGIFLSEYRIEVDTSSIILHRLSDNRIELYYRVDGDKIRYSFDGWCAEDPSLSAKYHFSGDTLVLQLVKGVFSDRYVISKYLKK